MVLLNFLSDMKMKQVAFLLIFIAFGALPVFCQMPESESESPISPSEDEQVVENDEEDTDGIKPVTPSTTTDEEDSEAITSETPPTTADEVELENEEQDTESVITDDNDNEEKTPITEDEEDEVEAQSDDLANVPFNWEGTRRIFKLVNDYYLAPDEVVTTVIMISGDATIHGTVTGNVLVIGGDVELSKNAQVGGMVQVVGGKITGDYESTENHIVSNNWRILPASAYLLMHPHTVWDIRKHRNFRFTTLKFGLLLLTYLLMAITFRKPINVVSSMLVERPVGSILFSLLMFVVIPVVIWVIILSIVGFPLLILCLCLLVPLALCGKTAIFYTLGSTLLAGRLKPLAVIFGFIPYFMATEIPHVDWVTFLLFNVVGVGLCILSIISALSSQSHSRNIHWSDRVRNNAS